jgi:hypothetical protein
MTISEADLKLLKSERLTDASNGGGQITGQAVVDGQVNNLFNDISQMDRTYGRVSLRKAYMSVQSANADPYLGAHIILTDAPDDQNVQVTLYSTESWTDERDAARDRIESYSIQGPESRWVLFGDHIVGQKMIRAFSLSNAASMTAPASDPSLEVGDVMMLKQEKAGYTAQYQFVRITKLTSRETQKFTDGSGDFYKDVLIVEIGNPLSAYYYGAVVTRLSTHGSPTLIRETSVADAAQYFSVKKITQALTINDTVVNVGSPYTALVPSATAETPLVDVVAGMTKAHYKQAGLAGALTATASLAGSVAPDYADDLFLGRGVLPNTMALSIAGTAYKDDAHGGLILASGGSGSYAGTVDYASGHIRITKASAWSVSVSAAATAAVAVYDNASTVSIPISINNRAFNYVQTLQPPPGPVSLSVDYKALNKWYRLSDDGSGHLTGAAGTGTGTIDYATGSAMVTLGAMPDVDSALIFSWATPAKYTLQTAVLTPRPPQVRTTLTDVPVVPATLTISWANGGAKSATADASGVISGDASGTIVHETGSLVFTPALIPPADTIFNLAWSQNLALTDVFSVTGDGNGVVNFTLSQTPVKPGSVNLTYQVEVPSSDGEFLAGIDQALTFPNTPAVRVVHDNGTGGILDEAGNLIAGSNINYATGAVSFDATAQTSIRKLVGTAHGTATTNYYFLPNESYEWTMPYYNTIAASQSLAGATSLTAHYALNSAVPSAKVGSVTLTEIKIDLTTVTADDLVAGSVKFRFAGTDYFDRAGAIYRGHDPLTDAATAAGSIDYQTGIATLTNWVAGANTLTLAGLVSTPGQSYAASVYFRAPGAPLATGQFQISAVTRNGDNITAAANNNGQIISEWITGQIDWLSGVGSMVFGKRLLDSGLPAAIKAAAWYNAANIGADGKIYVPLLVKPETIKFNAVLISYLPLDADILGVDTVRLPQDGKVPVFRTGNVAVIHHTLTTTLSNPAVAGATLNLGRIRLAYAKLFDAEGLAVPTDQYMTDLDAGTITLANPLNLASFTQPLHCEHRIEDMSLVTDVQITGQVALMKPVTHDFPATDTLISSALIIGDLQARTQLLFEQQTWTSVWADALIGNASTAQFNDALYPLVLTNKGAIQERWALVFTGTTAFNVYGEYSGLVGQGNIAGFAVPTQIGDTLVAAVHYAVENPDTGTPYFIINCLAFGGGWSAGNVIRFNTIAANYPLWLARTTLQSSPVAFTDSFKLQIRGDAN